MTEVVDLSPVGSVAAYESMCRWIAESESLADCKDIADKSAALKEYARRAKNLDAERRAANVRLVAERRYGELLATLARTPKQDAAPNGRAGNHVADADVIPEPSPYAQALADTGVTRQQAHRYQALAAVPKQTFDEALRAPEIPTRAGVMAKAEAVRAVQEARDPQHTMPSDSLRLWGQLREMERERVFEKDAAALLAPMTETMCADMRRLAPLAAEFFQTMAEATHEHA